MGASMISRQLWIGAALAVVGTATGAIAQTPIPPSGKDFAMAAAQSDQYEIQAGRVALTESQSASIRTFAQEMIEEHTRTSESVSDAAAASGLPRPPQGMSSDQAAMLSALQSLRGAEFDKAYAKQQVLAHYQALAVEKSYAAAGMDVNLRAAAQSSVPIIQHHLEMAQQIRKTLDGS